MTKLKGPDEVILNRGQRAPFYGVLTPEQRWRMKEETLEVCDIFEKTKCPPQDPCPNMAYELFWATTAGAALGILLTVVLTTPK